MNTVRRKYGLALAAALAVAAIVPLVASAIIQHDWQGHIKGDPGSFITFNRVKNDEGVKRVRDVVAGGLDFSCESGPDGETDAVTVLGKFRVRHSEFGGKRDAILEGNDPRAIIFGKFRPGKRAVGTVKVRGKLDPEGRPDVKCSTGRQEWRAHKQPPSPP